MDLITRIVEKRAAVAVVGLGYVGLPLAVEASRSGFTVTGVDTDEALVTQLLSGRSHIPDVTDDELSAQIRNGRFRPTTDRGVLEGADVIVICVPTPLRNDLPDLSFVEAAAADIAATLRREQLVILESTTYPGTTEELVRSILEQSGLVAGQDFFLGFSPERINPGDQRFGLTNVPKIVGGIDARSTELMEAFYSTFIDKVVRVSSPKAAEMAKLLENTYRHVNIALANEIAILCHDLGIDVWEVIDAAATKPFGFQPFYPGPGWGGHCIPVDPAFLSWRVRQMGETARFVELAREINKRMPAYVVQRLAEVLNDHGKSLKGSRVLVLGVAYKPEIGDVRESPAVEIIERLAKAGAEVSYSDPHVASFGDLSSQPLSEEVVADADVVLIHTDHSAFDWGMVAAKSKAILDTRNALRGLAGPITRI